jgi:leader peptidase (prepilin peptidase)/N-methyltransferase
MSTGPFPAAWQVILVAPFIGSWLGVLARRWPRGQETVWARSACEHCAVPLGPAELVPLVSFAILRGRCRHCGAPIGWFHPAIELASVAVAAAAAFADGSGWPCCFDAALGWTLLLAAWIDAQTQRLPDFLTLPLVLAGLAVTALNGQGGLYTHAAAAALGYLGFRLLDEAYFRLRHRHGLGAGDAKLLAAAGAWLGLAALPNVILLAGVLGLVTALTLKLRARTWTADQPIPFGPALALAFFCLQLYAR